MILNALLFTSEYLPPRQNITLPLIHRLPSHRIGYLSIGYGGITTAVLKTEKHGVVVEKAATNGATFSSILLAEEAIKLKKKIKGMGKPPVVIGISQGLHWTVRNHLDFQSQDDFISALRTDPQRVLGDAQENLAYTGILQPNTNAALIFGINKADLVQAEDAVLSKGMDPVRRTVPALSMMNLLLGDPRVQSREMIPVVVDQGHILAVTSNDSGWESVQARKFLGTPAPENAIGALMESLGVHGGETKLLVASSDSNGGIDAETILRASGATVTTFSIGNLPASHLFPYATAIF